MEEQPPEENNSEQNKLNQNNEADAQVEVKKIYQNANQRNKEIRQNNDCCYNCCYKCCYDCCSYSCSCPCSCPCSEDVKFWLRIICCPCFCFIYRFFICFFDDRYESEPYYGSILFVDNVLFGIASIIDLIFLIIYKGDLNMGFFVVRIISDSIGIFVLWFSFTAWDEEALDEDHMDPAFLFLTIGNTVITCLLDFVSWIIFLSIDFKLNTTLYASLFFHFVLPIIMAILFKFR